MIWVSLERPFPPAEMYIMPTLVKGDDVRSGTKATARHGRLRARGSQRVKSLTAPSHMLCKFYLLVKCDSRLSLLSNRD